VRDFIVLSCCLVREQSSLRAFAYVLRNWRRVMQKRRAIMQRRRVSDDYMARWFSYSPVSEPARPPSRTAARTAKVARG